MGDLHDDMSLFKKVRVFSGLHIERFELRRNSPGILIPSYSNITLDHVKPSKNLGFNGLDFG